LKQHRDGLYCNSSTNINKYKLNLRKKTEKVEFRVEFARFEAKFALKTPGIAG
jgi:hypothetical protein